MNFLQLLIVIEILPLNENEYIKTNIEIAQLEIPFKIIMSASLLEDQVENSHIFSKENNELTFADEEFTLSSITNLYDMNLLR